MSENTKSSSTAELPRSTDPNTALFVHAQVETSERVEKVDDKVDMVGSRLDGVIDKISETNRLLERSLVNQEHITKNVDDNKRDVDQFKAETTEKFETVQEDIGILNTQIGIKNSQLSLAKWISSIVITAFISWMAMYYLPQRDKETKLDQTIELLTDIISKDTP